MPTSYTGNPANITSPLAATVANATNANPINITTSAPHLFGNGDTVQIVGVTGNTAANGTWPITVTGPSHFTIPVAGNGAYVSGGTCTDLSFTPQVNIPSDGDPRNVSSINPSIQLALDRTQYLKLRIGTDRIDELDFAQGQFNFDLVNGAATATESIFANVDVEVGTFVLLSVCSTIQLKLQSAAPVAINCVIKMQTNLNGAGWVDSGIRQTALLSVNGSTNFLLDVPIALSGAVGPAASRGAIAVRLSFDATGITVSDHVIGNTLINAWSAYAICFRSNA